HRFAVVGDFSGDAGGAAAAPEAQAYEPGERQKPKEDSQHGSRARGLGKIGDDFTARARSESTPGKLIDGVGEETDGTIGQGRVDAAVVVAAGSGVSLGPARLPPSVGPYLQAGGLVQRVRQIFRTAAIH